MSRSSGCQCWCPRGSPRSRGSHSPQSRRWQQPGLQTPPGCIFISFFLYLFFFLLKYHVIQPSSELPWLKLSLANFACVEQKVPWQDLGRAERLQPTQMLILLHPTRSKGAETTYSCAGDFSLGTGTNWDAASGSRRGSVQSICRGMAGCSPADEHSDRSVWGLRQRNKLPACTFCRVLVFYPPPPFIFRSKAASKLPSSPALGFWG